MSVVVLDISNISKRFGATMALEDVSITIKKGTVHALVGRNGAGKTTLVNIVAGIIRQDSGRVQLEGRDISNLSVFDRQSLGIRMATQHASIVPYLTVAENVFMGIWPKNRFGLVDWDGIYRGAVRELEDYGLDVDPRVEVRRLSSVDQRKVNIVRALFGGAKVVILDEPTTSLSAEERDSLFGFVTRLSRQGTTFVLISHYLEEIVKMSDEITVLRDGKSYSGYYKGKIDEEKLAGLIAGENVKLYYRKQLAEKAGTEPILKCNEVFGPNMNGINFSLYPGEIVGLVGFPGSGAREICRALYGLLPIEKGELEVRGSIIQRQSPFAALKQGVVYIPNDRHKEGIIQQMSIKQNISLPILTRKLCGRWRLLNSSKEEEIAAKFFRELRVKANTMEDTAGSLSGGNQQKVVLAKVLACDPRVLILDEPTVGIDIKSREEILATVDGLTKAGVSVLYLTNDYGELLRVADRLLFFDSGCVVREETNRGLSAEDVIKIRDSVRSVMHE